MNRSPDFNLYVLPPKDSANDAPWVRTGAGWLNRDDSVNLIINAPLAAGTRVQLRKAQPKTEQAAG